VSFGSSRPGAGDVGGVHDAKSAAVVSVPLAAAARFAVDKPGLKPDGLYGAIWFVEP
jgi:hypothetical protein